MAETKLGILPFIESGDDMVLATHPNYHRVINQVLSTFLIIVRSGRLDIIERSEKYVLRRYKFKVLL